LEGALYIGSVTILAKTFFLVFYNFFQYILIGGDLYGMGGAKVTAAEFARCIMIGNYAVYWVVRRGVKGGGYRASEFLGNFQ
jgi:hypothetical protein